MVQFREKADPKGREYWKLNYSPGNLRKVQEDLANFGTVYPATTPLHRLSKLHERSQRALLAYDACGVGDLRRFCTARHIKLEPRMSKEKLIEELETADDQAVFRYVADFRVTKEVIALISII